MKTLDLNFLVGRMEDGELRVVSKVFLSFRNQRKDGHPEGGGGGQTPQKHKNREGTASIFVFLYAIPHRRATGAILQGSSDRLKCDDEINAHANYIDHNLDSFHQPYERTW